VLKATMKVASGTIVLLGLTHKNLDRLRAQGLEGFIKVDGKELGIGDIEIIITAAETEAHMAHALRRWITPETKVHIDPKLKS